MPGSPTGSESPERFHVEQVESPPPLRARRTRRPRWLAVALAVLAALGVMLVFGRSRFEPLLRKFVAGEYAGQATEAQRRDDLPAAAAALDRAVEWAPTVLTLRQMRARVRLKSNDLEGALADVQYMINKNPEYGESYIIRADIYSRQRRFDLAIADADHYVNLRPAMESPPLNLRAYTRALAGMQLPEALDDVDRALRLVDDELRQVRTEKNDDLRKELESQLLEQRASYLDTRGYIRHLSGDQSAALEDLNQAVELNEARAAELLGKTPPQDKAESPSPTRRRYGKLCAFDVRVLNEGRAVIITHRGMVHQALGNQAEAKRDLDRGKELGYDPEKGVW